MADAERNGHSLPYATCQTSEAVWPNQEKSHQLPHPLIKIFSWHFWGDLTLPKLQEAALSSVASAFSYFRIA
jgi:hypothetical protein